MAGHSKWANIQHRKGRQDKLRSKLFSKLAKDIATASKIGGPDPDMNPRLRLAIANAKVQSMPKDNIQRAVDKGAGGEGDDYEEIRYEGFGPAGIGFIVEASTDNKNRSAMEIRTAFSKNGGNLGESGSVSFMFDQVGKIEYPLDITDEAAEDQWDEYEPVHTIWTARDDLGDVSAALNEKFGDAKSVNLVWKAQNDIDNPSAAAQIVRLQDALEDLDDVENVYHNFDMTEEAAATLENDA